MERKKAKDEKEVLISIHRHWIWADRMREEYFERLKATPPSDPDPVSFFLTGHGMYLCIWFGLEFAVWDQLRSRDFVVPNAAKEIAEIRNSLNDFRNTIFHIQPEYFSERMLNLLKEPDHQTKISKAHKEIGEWLTAKIYIELD